MLKSLLCDMIITCIGTKPILPPVPGIENEHVITAVEFSNHVERYTNHEKIVVIGGADVGCEVARMLAYEYDKSVTIVEMGSYLMPKTCTSNRHHMIYHLN